MMDGVEKQMTSKERKFQITLQDRELYFLVLGEPKMEEYVR